MVAWIVYFRDGANYNRKYIEFYKEEGKKLDIDVELILVEDLEFGVEQNHWFIRHQGMEVTYPDFVICRAIYPLLNKQFEYMGIKVFNNSFVAEICNDKAKTYQYLAKTGIRMVDSSFFKNSQVKDIISLVDQPTVIKTVDGHGGSQVFLLKPGGEPHNDRYMIKDKSEERIEDSAVGIAGERIEGSTEGIVKERIEDSAVDITGERIEDSEEICKVVKGLGSSDVVIQPLTGNRHQDLRVYVIGKEIIACVLRTAKEGFKSNFSLGGEVSLYQLSNEERSLVDIVISQFEFGLVGIDFIIGDSGELIFNEIEDVVGSRMLYQCSDINIVERYLKYILDTIKVMKFEK